MSCVVYLVEQRETVSAVVAQFCVLFIISTTYRAGMVVKVAIVKGTVPA